VFFDFDQTLSVWHIFYLLSGQTQDGVSIRPPFARTERGQLARLAELDETPEFKPGGFALSAFGGRRRVQELRAFLIKLCKKRFECFICARGLVGPVRWCLNQLGLLDYFKKIYGTIGESYGATEYDLQVTDSHCDFQDLLGDPGQAGWQSKQNVVARCLHERGLGYKDAVFVDDQEHEISAMAATCTTVLVESQQGIGPAEFELIWQKAICSQKRKQSGSDGRTTLSNLQRRKDAVHGKTKQGQRNKQKTKKRKWGEWLKLGNEFTEFTEKMRNRGVQEHNEKGNAHAQIRPALETSLEGIKSQGIHQKE